MVPVVLARERRGQSLRGERSVWGAVVALALISTAFAYILYFNLIAEAGATNASLVTLIVPASAILLGAIFLGERLAADRGGRHGGNRRWTGHYRRQGLWQRYHDAWMTNSATILNKPIFEIFSTGKDGSAARSFP